MFNMWFVYFSKTALLSFYFGFEYFVLSWKGDYYDVVVVLTEENVLPL